MKNLLTYSGSEKGRYVRQGLNPIPMNSYRIIHEHQIRYTQVSGQKLSFTRKYCPFKILYSFEKPIFGNTEQKHQNLIQERRNLIFKIMRYKGFIFCFFFLIGQKK